VAESYAPVAPVTATTTTAHAATHDAHAHTEGLQHHFDNMEQQREAGTLGMWIFLVTEIMFFGGMFMAYILYRSFYPEAFAEASSELNALYGGINTIVLIGSSLTVVLAVYAAQTGNRRNQVLFLALTILLGFVFLGIKSIEYAEKFEKHHIPGPGFRWDGADAPHAQMFFFLYFAMTGVHALHMIIGIGVFIALLIAAQRGRYSPEYHGPIEVGGLYWHFVDIVWIFLFPLLYLLGNHVHHR
jgi:cytochrome c oxidase subunit 3